MFPTGIKLQIFEFILQKGNKYEIQQLSTNNPAVRKIFNRNLCINNSNNNNIQKKKHIKQICQFGFTQKSPGAIGENIVNLYMFLYVNLLDFLKLFPCILCVYFLFSKHTNLFI